MSGYEKCRACGGKLAAKAKAESPWYPFCSERCRWVDLGRWFDQEYGLAEGKGPLGEEGEGRQMEKEDESEVE